MLNASTEGFVSVPGGQVWYQVVGADRPGTPFLILHGGPGSGHQYLRTLEALSDERPVIFYDQLGCGKSDRPDDVRLWTTERFVEELSVLRRHLGLSSVHLLGHSWGGILAVEYAAREPEGIESLILASPALHLPRWMEDMLRLCAALPTDVAASLAACHACGEYASDDYRKGEKEFYRRHLCRIERPAEERERSRAAYGKQVYETMWGPSEFHVTGNLVGRDSTPHLGSLPMPVLYTCGRYDEATPESTAAFHAMTPHSSLVIFEESAHLAHVEEEKQYIDAVQSFLARP